MDKNTLKRILFIMFILVCIFFRVYRLVNDSLSQDEFHSLQIIERGNFFNLELNPPFYFMFLSVWAKIFGLSDISIRFPSLIFDMISVAMIYLLGERFIRRDAGKYAAVLSLLSCTFIFHSSDAKTYSLYLLLSLASSYLLLDLIKKRTVIGKLLYVISGTLLIYTNYFGFFILFSHAIYIIGLLIKNKDPKKMRSLLSLYLIIFLFFLPYIFNFALQLRTNYVHEWYGPLDFYGTLGNTILEWSNFLPLFIVVMLIIVFSLNLALNMKPELFQTFAFLLGWLMIPILTSYVISISQYNIFGVSRFFIGALPAYYLLLSLSISHINNKKIIEFIMSAIIIGGLIFNIYLINTDFKSPWREVSDRLASKYDSRSYNLLVLNYDYMKESFDRYYKPGNIIFMLDYMGKDYMVKPIRWRSPCNSSLMRIEEDLKKIDPDKSALYVYNDNPDYDGCNDVYLDTLKKRYTDSRIVESYCTKGYSISGWKCSRIDIYEFFGKI